MKHYLALVNKDEDSAYGIEFPDLPNVFSASDTEDAVLKNAIEALQLYAEDEDMPEPSSLSDLRNQDEIKVALQNGGYFVSVPLIINDSAIKRINVTFERGVLDAIDETAKQRGLTRAAFLAQAARREIELA